MKRLVLLWLASLVVVAVLTSAFTLAQAQQDGAPVVSGDDLGFRVDGRDRSGKPTGTLVIRVDDEWVEASFSMSSRLIR